MSNLLEADPSLLESSLRIVKVIRRNIKILLELHS